MSAIVPDKTEVNPSALKTGLLEAVRWDAYLGKHPAASVFCRSAWEQVFAVYGLRFTRLAAFRDSQVVGICPLVPMTSWLFGHQLVSLPWFDTAGIVADDDSARSALIAGATELAARKRIGIVQFRCREAQQISPFVRNDKVLMELELGCTADELWHRHSAKVRNQIRKGQKSGLTVIRGGRELLDDFYRVYSENMRDLGSPPHGRRFFSAILDVFSAETSLYVVRSGQTTVGAGWVMGNGAALEIPWASSLRRFGNVCVNHFMYAEILADAATAGYSAFRFGRSSVDSGTYRFKKQWGAQAIPLNWYLVPVNGAEPDTKPVQDGYGWATRVWQRLPIGLSSCLGPRLISQIP